MQYLPTVGLAIVATTLICQNREIPVDDGLLGSIYQIMPFSNQDKRVKCCWILASMACVTGLGIGCIDSLTPMHLQIKSSTFTVPIDVVGY